jgi:hypothetical protein
VQTGGASEGEGVARTNKRRDARDRRRYKSVAVAAIEIQQEAADSRLGKTSRRGFKEVDVREKRGCSFAQSLSLSESLRERSSFLSRLRKIESSATGAGARVDAGVGRAAGVGTVEVLPFRRIDLSTAGTAALVGKGAVRRGEGGSGA